MKLRLPPAVPLALLLLAALQPAVGHAQDMQEVQIEASRLAPGVYMLMGRGGNLGVSAGKDGVFVIDDQYAPLTEKIVAAIREFSDGPIRFVLNTHWHGDHTGGNENMGKEGALIVAQDNVRERMSVEQFIEAFDMKVPPAPEAALPVVTFSEEITFHLNGDDLWVFHVDSAHTDGDAVIVFSAANVVHTGDVMFNGFYPFIDVSSGGSIDGVIAATERILALVDESTRIIPGHGPLADKADLQRYLDMLIGARAAIAGQIAMGKSRAEVIAAKPTARWDEEWGGAFLKPEQFVDIVYSDLARKR